MRNTLTTKILMVIAGLIIAGLLAIFILSCFTDTTVSQTKQTTEKKQVEKKVPVSAVPRTQSGELILVGVTHMATHFERRPYPPYVVIIIDSVYYREEVK
jgi:hypothetical protein